MAAICITVDKLKKQFVVPQKKPGWSGLLSSIVKPEKRIVRAVDGISFTVREGELIGFIGPNGAGKTTTLKMLSGILYPTSGSVHILDHIPWKREEAFLKRMTLVMGQKNQLWWELPAMDSLLLNKAIYELSDIQFEENLRQLDAILEIGDLLATPVRRLSLGQRMRLELVAALIHKPKLLFLDEPTIGLDVVAAEKIREFISVYNKKTGATILLTSHYMGDIARLASRVIIIDQGHLLFDGKLASIIERWVKTKVIKLDLAQEPPVQELEKIGEVIAYQYPHAEIRVSRPIAPLAAAQLLQKFSVADLTIEEPPIEEVIMKIFLKSKV